MDEQNSRKIALYDYEDSRTEAINRLQYQVDYSQNLFKGLMLANGGAVLALLTFIGNTQAKVERFDIWWAFCWYGMGLAGVLIAYLGGFLSQYYFYFATIKIGWNAQANSLGEKPTHKFGEEMKAGNAALYLGICAAALSTFAFVVGSGCALNAII